MKTKIRRPKKSIKLSKWAMLLAYAFVVLTVSCSMTLAKYITIGTSDNEVRVATAGEYMIRLSSSKFGTINKTKYYYLELHEEAYPINKYDVVGANSSADTLFYIFNDDSSEVAYKYSIEIITSGKLPISISLEKVISGEESGKYVDIDNANNTISNNTANTAELSDESEGGIYNNSWTWTGGVFPPNTEDFHGYKLLTKWDDTSTEDNYLLNKEDEEIKIILKVEQLDEYIG